MRNNIKIFLLILAFILNTFISNANTDESLHIFILDTKHVIEQSAAFKEVMRQIEELNKKYSDIALSKQSEIINMNKKLELEKNSMNEMEYQRKVLELSNKSRDIYEEFHKRKAEIDNALDIASKKIDEVLDKVVEAYIESTGRKNVIIINRSAVIYAKSFDITDIILEKLNKHISKLTIYPKNENK